jgi:hypothetical protein
VKPTDSATPPNRAGPPVLFLDIDGVLNGCGLPNGGPESENVALPCVICRATGCQFLTSSNRRDLVVRCNWRLAIDPNHQYQRQIPSSHPYVKLSSFPCLASLSLAGVLLGSTASTVRAVLFSNFAEAGTTVNGYQDDFTGGSLNPAWVEIDGGNDDGTLFQLSGIGSLTMLPAGGDPNKLLYNPPTPYNGTVQEVLALIRVDIDPVGDTDAFRGGVTTTSDLITGQGFNLHFREPGQPGGAPANNHFNLLNDQMAWGPSSAGDDWAAGSYKWLRIRRELNADGTNDVFGKVWDAGASPEPGPWSITWNHDNPRSGLAGLVTNSIGGQGQFDVDYVLIKADGLPSITVVPEPSAALFACSSMALLCLRRRNRHP